MFNFRKSKVLLVGVAAGIMPISSACSSDKSTAANQDPTTFTIDITSVPLEEVVPFSAECGIWREGESAPDGFASEHISIENDRANFLSISNKRLPKEILYSKDSNDLFINLIATLKTSITSVPVPIGAAGDAIITFPGLTPEQSASYRLSIDKSGNITLANDTNALSAVSVQSKREGKHNEVYVATIGNNFQVLQPGSSWISDVDELPELNGSDLRGFKLEQSGKPNINGPFIYLNKPATEPTEKFSAIAFSPEMQTACNVLVGFGNAKGELGASR